MFMKVGKADKDANLGQTEKKREKVEQIGKIKEAGKADKVERGQG